MSMEGDQKGRVDSKEKRKCGDKNGWSQRFAP